MNLDALLKAMSEPFGTGIDASSTAAAIRTVLRDPSENTTLSLVLLSAVVLAVVLLAVVLLVFVTPSRKKVVKIRRYAGPRPVLDEDEEEDAAPQPSEPPRKAPGKVFLALTGSVTVTMLVLLALVGVYVATSTNLYCATTCHGASDSVASADKLGHAWCISCHEAGPFNVVANTSSRARMALDYALGRDPKVTAVAVDSFACLRCHAGDIRQTTTSARSGVRMSHKEVTSAGRACTACHASSGHTGTQVTAAMASCLPCHDTRKASAECDLCHTKDPVAVAFVSKDSREPLGSGNVVYPAVRAANRECGACHDQPKQCDRCHGIRMPHSREFREGEHARWAAFTGKLMCWKCHDPQSCGKSGCHQSAFSPVTGDTTHGSNWKQQHRTGQWTGGCVCHSGRSQRKTSMCGLCHSLKTHALLPKVP